MRKKKKTQRLLTVFLFFFFFFVLFLLLLYVCTNTHLLRGRYNWNSELFKKKKSKLSSVLDTDASISGPLFRQSANTE